MIPFEFNKKSRREKSACVKKYKKFLLAGTKERNVEELDWWCRNYLKRAFEEVIEMPYEELCELKENLDWLHCEGEILPAHLKKYIIGTLYRDHVPRTYLIDSLGVTVCPYCNRAYINRTSKYTVCQLDHFFDKSAYPIMAVSFYNLIPVCGTCNWLKRQKLLEYSPYDKRFDSADQLLEFGFKAENEKALSGVDRVTAITIHSKQHCMGDNVKKLELTELYQIHTDIVQEPLYKKKAYPKLYQDYLKGLCEGIKVDPGRVIIGNYTTPESYGKRPLAKMMADIGKKTGLID